MTAIMNERSHFYWSRGFTLVELMVSIAVGLVIMVALSAVYLNVSRTNTEMSKTNGMIENGRFAMDLLQEDIAHAGYWGGYLPSWDDFTAASAGYVDDSPTRSPNPCLDFAVWPSGAAGIDYRNQLIGIPVQAYSDVPTGCSTIITNKKANTDILVVRRAELCVPGSGNCEDDNTSKVYFQASRCESEISAGNRYVLDRTGFTLTNRDCVGASPTIADKRKFVSDIYYVRTWSVAQGDNIPTLVRSSFNLGDLGGPGGAAAGPEAPVALIEGIESFIVDLGVDAQDRCGHAVNYASSPSRIDPATCSVSAAPMQDTMPGNRGDGVPESYVHCGAAGCTATQLRDVVAAKVFLLARTRDPAVGENDGKTYTLGDAAPVMVTPAIGDKYRRHLFQSTIRLNNVSGRRESP
jgi:type IV pilus assembly protein PilW